MRSEELRKARKNRKWTQKEMAAEYHYSIAQYQRFESGECDVPPLLAKCVELQDKVAALEEAMKGKHII